MRIGEASTASGVPERMIRHYEKLGLIPAPSRRASGYRVYDEDDVRRLSLIARARRVGFELSDIAAMLDAAMTDRQAVSELRERLAGKMADLEELARDLGVQHSR